MSLIEMYGIYITININYCFFHLADLPLAKVKVGELGEWIGRRNLGPSGIAGGVSRGKTQAHFLNIKSLISIKIFLDFV